MPGATWQDIDFETDSATEYKTGIDNNMAVLKRGGGDAFAAHEYYEGSPPILTMKVALEAGWLFSNGVRAEVAAQQTGVISAPASNPRIDLVYIDRITGAVGVAAGTEDPAPVAPALPSGKLPIALVSLTVSTTEITNAVNLTDVRGLWPTLVGTEDLADDAVTTAKILDGAVTTDKLDAAAAIPVGAVMPYGGSSAPTGWLLCNGSAVSRTTYAALFAILSTTYGVGDGSTTFNLPDLQGRMPLGAGSGAGLTTRARGDKAGAETHSHALSNAGGVDLAVASVGDPLATVYYRSSTISTGISLTVNRSAPLGAESTFGPNSRTAIPLVGNTDSGDGMNPFLGVNFIIKT